MGAPTVYYYDDPGAPVLTNIQDAFYQILMACLVNGYGSKPAAGWSVVHDQWAAHGHASFTNNTESGVLGLVRNISTESGSYLYVAEAMVDYQTAVNARSGMRSNINPATLATASLQGRQRAHGAQWQRWVCIADEQGAWVFFSSDDNRLFNPWNTKQDSMMYGRIYFGAVTSYFNGSRVEGNLGNFIIAGGSGDNANLSEWYQLNNNHPSTLFYNKDGLIAGDGSLLSFHPFWVSGVGNIPAGSQPDGFPRFYLFPVQIIDATQPLANRVLIGELSFLKSCWELSTAANSSLTVTRDFAQRLQPSGQTLRDPVLIDGVSHLMAPMGWYAYALISLDAADWA